MRCGGRIDRQSKRITGEINVADKGMSFLGIFDRFKPKPSFLDESELRIRNAIGALLKELATYVAKTYPLDGDAIKIAALVCNLITGQPENPRAYEGRTSREVELAEQIASTLPFENEKIRIRAAFISGALALHYQTMATQTSSVEPNKECLENSLKAALKPFDYGSKDGSVLAVAAKSYAMLGLAEDGLTFAGEAVELSPGDFNTHYTLGLIAFKMGRYDIAKPSLETALKLEPRLQGVKDMIALIR